MKTLRMTDEQARLVEDILAGALEDIECDAAEGPNEGEYEHACARKAKILRPIVNAFTAVHCNVADVVTDEEKRS